MGNEETAAPCHETSAEMFPCNVTFCRILWHFDMLQPRFNLQNNNKKKSHATKACLYYVQNEATQLYISFKQEEEDTTGTGRPLSRQPHSDD